MAALSPRARVSLVILALLSNASGRGQAVYQPPASPRRQLNLNADWKFIREDVPGGQNVALDDSAWQTISTPHSFNETDSFRTIISHGGGDRGTYKGLAWYRKRFTLPTSDAGRKIFLEFEGMRQAGDVFLNGKEIGLYENGITAYGIDITNAMKFGQDNVLAVQVDNRITYTERATGTPFEWNVNDFNPDYGGINRHVWIHVTGRIYQTLPLYDGLETTGTYIYGQNYDIPAKSTDVTVESQVKNESSRAAAVTLSAVLVNHDGSVAATFAAAPVQLASGSTAVLAPPASSSPRDSGASMIPISTTSTPFLLSTISPSTSAKPPPASARPSSKAAQVPAGFFSTITSSISQATPNEPATNGPASARVTPIGCTISPPN